MIEPYTASVGIKFSFTEMSKYGITGALVSWDPVDEDTGEAIKSPQDERKVKIFSSNSNVTGFVPGKMYVVEVRGVRSDTDFALQTQASQQLIRTGNIHILVKRNGRINWWYSPKKIDFFFKSNTYVWE